MTLKKNIFVTIQTNRCNSDPVDRISISYMDNLIIYEASAGSGKTFNLTREYLRILFAEPLSYRHILAVTFTNKATAEMKSRIILELYRLANNNPSEHTAFLLEETDLSANLLQQKAIVLLNLILHNFSRFSVTTIDKFFQQVLRGFAREAGLNSAYKIETETDPLLAEVTDRLFYKADSDRKLQKWLVDFAKNKIGEGKSWNFSTDIQKLGKEIFTEKFKSFNTATLQKLEDREFLESYMKKMYAIRNSFEKRIKELGQRGIGIINSAGLTSDDFTQKSRGIGGYFAKLAGFTAIQPNSYVLNALNNSEKWHPKKSDAAAVIDEIYPALNDIAVKAVETYNNEIGAYNTTSQILSNFYTLGIITDISHDLHQYTAEENIMLLADSGKLLHEIIAGNEAPFIYEKTGNTYQHFMIDEFQDTSRIQWENFSPLIDNSLSGGNRNILVGDVKQSIYRWRNGDWKILAMEIPETFVHTGIAKINLETNWRSRQNIISFNNKLFEQAAHTLQQYFNNQLEEAAIQPDNANLLKDMITAAYQSVKQQSPENNAGKSEGFVQNIFYPLQDKESEEQVGWKDKVHEELPGIIEKLQDNNYELRDIAILVRSAADGKQIADVLMACKNSHTDTSYKYEVISGESVYLTYSTAVRFLIYLLKYLTDETNDLNSASLISEYQQYILPALTNRPSPSPETFHQAFCGDNGRITSDGVYRVMPDGFSKRIAGIKKLPLFESVEQLIRYFKLNTIKTEIPYLQTFQDLITSFATGQSPDLHAFLEYWEEEGHKKAVPAPELQNAIRIMTIHKAKGLQFKAVIVPYCNWETGHKKGAAPILWCEPGIPPFNELPVVPVGFTTALKDTIFRGDYYLELLQTYMDNLNLLYVALTRAENALFTFSAIPSKEGTLNTVGELMHQILTVPGLPRKDQDQNNGTSVCYTSGALEKLENANKDFHEWVLQNYPSFALENKLHFSVHADDFFELNESLTSERIQRGTILHALFRYIITASDIISAVDRLIFEGMISENEKDRFIKLISTYLEQPDVRNWFSGDWKVKTEADILLNGGRIKRPDRVMIKGDQALVVDYKFGEQVKESHRQQISEYARLLWQMGYKNVKACLWYPILNKVEDVDFSPSLF